jgi:hypothetical protein
VRSRSTPRPRGRLALIMIGDPAPLRARSGRNPGRGGRVRRPETPKLVAAKRGNDETAGPSTPIDRHRTQARPPVREARSRLRLYLARLSKMYLSVRPGPVSVTAEVLRPDASRARSGHQEHRPPSTLGLGFCRYILARCFMLRAFTPSPRRPAGVSQITFCSVVCVETNESTPRGSAHVTSAPGAFGPVGRRATTGGRARTLVRAPTALCGLARTDKQHKRRARRAHYQSIEASFYA